MPNDDADAPTRWQRAALALLAAGVASILLSLVLPMWMTGQAAWSADQSQRLQQVSADLHRYSHQLAQDQRTGPPTAVADKLRRAQAEYAELSQQLEAARRRPAKLATVLRGVGIVLAAAGGVWHLAARRG